MAYFWKHFLLLISIQATARRKEGSNPRSCHQEGKICSIIMAKELSPDCGGMTGGIAEKLGAEMIENSKGKVFVSTHWDGVLANVDWLLRQNKEDCKILLF